MSEMCGRKFDKSEVVQILKEKAEYKEMSEKLERLSDAGYDIEAKHQCIDGVFRSIKDIDEEKLNEKTKAEKEIVFDFIDSLSCGDEPVYTSSEDLYENYLKWKEEAKDA
jgi:hypothetical protein